MAQFIPLKLPPGVYKNGTLYQAKGRWTDANLVRWIEGAVRPWGGWEATQVGTEDLVLAADVALDTFTDTDETGLTSHTPDTGIGGWTDLGVGIGNLPTIQQASDSQASIGSSFLKMNNINTKHYQGDSDIGYDLTAGFDVIFRLARSTETFALDHCEIVIFQGNGASDQEGVYIDIEKNAGATCIVRIIRHNASRVAQETVTIDDNFSMAAQTGKTFKFEFRPNGSNWEITAFYKNLDGTGTYTQIIGDGTGDIGSPGIATITGAVTGASNDRIGIAGAGNSSASWMELDDLRVEQGGSATRVIRQLLGWKDNAGIPFLAIGSNDAVHLFTQGVLTDISPAGLVGGTVDSESNVGAYGQGPYGSENYGEGDTSQAVITEAGTWQLDNFGEDIVGVLTSDGKLWFYDTSTGGVMTQIVDASNPGQEPTGCDALVVTPERFLMALGADGDPRLVRWGDREVLDEWEDLETNSAGRFPLSGDGSLMCGRRGNNETLLFTDQDLWVAQFIGGTLVYSFKQKGSKCGIISRNAVAMVDSKAFWMGQRGFYFYDGYTHTLESDVTDHVFKSFNRTQRAKVFAVPFTNFGEVVWFYPSAGSEEPDRYVSFNYRERHWGNGELVRTAGIDRGAFDYPFLSSVETIFQHDRGTTKPGADAPFLESGPVELGRGDRVMNVLQIIPDEATTDGQQGLGSTQADLFFRLYPTADEESAGPFTMANPTDVRIQARQVRLRLTEVTPGDWRVGEVRLQVEPGGRR
jgi:hypothetical protein